MRQAIAATRGGEDPRAFDWTGPLALWITSETGALPPEAKDFEKLTIPMTGRAESLNVTVAAALLLFASGRAQDGGLDDAGSKSHERGRGSLEQRSSGKSAADRPATKPIAETRPDGSAARTRVEQTPSAPREPNVVPESRTSSKKDKRGG